MRSFGMVMFDEFFAEMVHVPLADDYKVVEAFLLDALHEPLDIGDRVGCPIGRPAKVKVLFLFQGGVEAGGELRVPIVHNDVGPQLLGTRMAEKGGCLVRDPGFVGMLRWHA